ncbi:MAG: hypothetical protein KatS3mg027_0215 [Bacteroidia bacterium]|nr:MAG: hypothetical protein KatS3mg027_0215 [Bacteroidia bacterium]
MKTFFDNISNSTMLVLLTAYTSLAQTTTNETAIVVEPTTSNNNVIGWSLVILLLIQLLVVRSISSAIKTIGKSEDVLNNSNRLQNLLVIGGLLFSTQLWSQDVTVSKVNKSLFSDTDIYVLVGLNILLSIVVLWMYYQFRQILKFSGLIKEEEEKASMWSIEQWLTRSVPIEKEATIQFEHEYDGIRELDNVLPPWWLWMFYATIIFSVVYLIHYHVAPIKALENIGFIGPGVGQEELYKMEMEQAEKEKQAYLAMMANNINENNVTKLVDASELAQGKEIYLSNCATCHGKEAQGGAGPNLTDDYWLHGGGIKNVFKTIKYGVPEKGMIAWETQLSPKQIQQVASYVLSLRGTNPAGAKEPQGELWKEDNETAATTDTTMGVK